MSELTMASVLHERVRERGEHPLLVCDDDRLSYAAAERRSARLARGLLGLGAAKGTHVGLLAPNGSQFICWMLAATRIGAVVVPFTTFSTAPELRGQLADSDVAILLSVRRFRSHDYAARLTDVLDGASLDEPIWNAATPNLRHVVLDDDVLGRIGDSTPASDLPAHESDIDGTDPLAVIYTSGSTSTPKGAVHTHGALLTHQRNLNEIRRLTADDRLFCNSAFFWIGGFGFGLLATLMAGATLVCSNDTDAARTLDLLEAERPTTTNGFDAAVAHLARHPSLPRRDLSSMTRGNLYSLMPQAVRPVDPELRHNMLGMTEAGGTLLLSADESDLGEERRGSFGRPAPGFATKLIDTGTGEPVGGGEPGELCIRGPFVMQHYHRRSREQCFDPDGWFHTGDVLCEDVDGFLYFLGRRDAMIKTAGANVSPVEVAAAITRATGATAYVIGLPDPQRGQVVVAVLDVGADDGIDLDAPALRRHLADDLSAYKIPRRVVLVRADDLPRLSSGKVDVRALAGLFNA